MPGTARKTTRKATPAKPPTPAAGAARKASGRTVIPVADLNPQPPAGEAAADTPEQPEPVHVEQLTVPFTWRGRDLLAKMPSEEQLAMMRRLAVRFESAPPSANAETMIKLADRAINILCTVLAREQDVEWIEDELLAGRVRLPDAVQMVQAAMQAVRDHVEQRNTTGHRAGRRAAGGTRAKRVAS